MYILLSGTGVFPGKDANQIMASNKECDIQYPSKYWKGASSDALSLVKSLLSTDPKIRPTAKEALKHPWFNYRRAAIFRSISQPPQPINVYKTMRSPRSKESRNNSPRGRNNIYASRDNRRDLNGSIQARRKAQDGIISVMRSKLIQI